MFGLFWNTYFTMSSIFKCFIPAKAFKTNSKFFSIIPETKHPNDEWMDVTIQIPVYKESLEDVLGPTLISCMDARNHYENNTRASCNIVVCDDGMMNMLRDNFSAAEMLWENVVETEGSLDIKSLLKRVPRAARRHLLGLRSKNIIEVYNRMVFYYQNKIGFVSRSTLDRRGKFKKASNINTHLRLVFGAQNITESIGKNFEDALLEVAHNDDGSRDIMFGNNVVIGDLIVINDADARMSPSVIMTTVPEFLNNSKLGFTQHATKTMDDQRGESCYLRLIEAYTDALYQGHFLLSSIIGCHPPLVGHSIFLRTDAVRQCGRLRMLKNAQRWLSNIGLPFVGVDQVGFENIQNEKRTEFWSESHVSEDFELMIHLYNIGYTGRYIAYPGCEFQEGVTRTFDEEAGRHRKFSLGAHELMFNPFQDWFGHGIFTPLFRNFLTFAAAGRLLDRRDTGSLYAFNPASVLVLNIVVYYVIGYTSFLIALCRKFLYRVLFYTVMGNYFFLGGMDHMMSRTRICGATNKDPLTVNCCSALKDIISFNSGSWFIAFVTSLLALAVVWEDYGYTTDIDKIISTIPSLQALLFAGPTAIMAIFAVFVPIILNPYVWGCYKRGKPKTIDKRKMLSKRDMYSKRDNFSVIGSVETNVYKAKLANKALSKYDLAYVDQPIPEKYPSTRDKPKQVVPEQNHSKRVTAVAQSSINIPRHSIPRERSRDRSKHADKSKRKSNSGEKKKKSPRPSDHLTDTFRLDRATSSGMTSI
eukprot:scaffold25655_cov56-Attheya_sp.AAC.1